MTERRKEFRLMKCLDEEGIELVECIICGKLRPHAFGDKALNVCCDCVSHEKVAINDLNEALRLEFSINGGVRA
jgi:hypothetical protein